MYSSGWQPKELFDNAYTNADPVSTQPVTSFLVAHHLLVAEPIAETLLAGVAYDGQTIVIVGPNHFSLGNSPAQTTLGTWETPYGDVTTDIDGVEKLRKAHRGLTLEELAFQGEHSVAALTPFIARSYPNSPIVPIILDESISSEEAYTLGKTIAQKFPDALLIASVDMVHGQDATFTAEWDEKLKTLIANNGRCGNDWCAQDMPIDSNASLRVLFAFNRAKGATRWQLTHHGSSLGMGATTTITDNVSHILGYFSQP